MTTNITAKDKFGFRSKEVTAYLIAYRDRIEALKKTRPWLYENLPAVLGIPMRKWTVRRTLLRFLVANRSVRTLRCITYCQIRKRAISNVILDIIRDSGKSEQEQKTALEIIKEAILFFESIPNIQPCNPSRSIDSVHKEWAERLSFQEVKRIKEHFRIPGND